MIERKKKLIDGMDREILRFLYDNPENTSNQISKQVNLSPSSISQRLLNLRKAGIVRSSDFGRLREYKRSYKNSTKLLLVNSIPKVLWSVDIVDVKRGDIK